MISRVPESSLSRDLIMSPPALLSAGRVESEKRRILMFQKSSKTRVLFEVEMFFFAGVHRVMLILISENEKKSLWAPEVFCETLC